MTRPFAGQLKKEDSRSKKRRLHRRDEEEQRLEIGCPEEDKSVSAESASSFIELVLEENFS